MKNMDPEKLKEMAKSSGMDINTDQMAQAMNAMENLKPEQMESMMKWATRLQKCMAFCAKPYALFKWTVSTCCSRLAYSSASERCSGLCFRNRSVEAFGSAGSAAACRC